MKKIINKLVYLISILLVLAGIFMDIFMHLGNLGKLLFYFLPMLLLLINMICQIKLSKADDEKNKIRKTTFKTIFIIYVIILLILLFFSSSYRNGNLFTWTRQYPLFSKENLSINMNIIPFKNIIEYIQKLINNKINTSIVITNILGNLLAFAPFGFFVQELFENRIKDLKEFSITMTVFILVIELVQFITRLGSFDIDDVILNLAGAIIVYVVYSIKDVKQVINKILE